MTPRMEESPTRRSFHTRAIYALWSLIGAALALPAAAYLLVPPRSKRSGDWVEATDLSRLTPGTPEEVIFRRTRVDGWKVIAEKASAWMLKSNDNQVTAFAPQCTHLGCAYHWDERAKNFLCPCHTSTFGIDGKVLSGPAPRPLDRYAVKIESGKVLLGPIEPAGRA